MKLRFYFDQKPWSDSTNIYVITEDERGNRHLAKPVELVFCPVDTSQSSDPTVQLSGPIARELFPALVQALAESGYRYESSDAGELKAAKIHLEDMRKIALDRLKS